MLKKHLFQERMEAKRLALEVEKRLAIGSTGADRDALVHSMFEGAAPGATSAREARNFSTVLGPVPLCSFSRPVKPTEIDDHVGKHHMTSLGQEWFSSHIGILDKTLPRIVGAKAKRRFCHEAQRCVCRGANKHAFYFACALQAAAGKVKKSMEDKHFNRLLHGGDLVCCFAWKVSSVWVRNQIDLVLLKWFRLRFGLVRKLCWFWFCEWFGSALLCLDMLIVDNLY